LGVLVERRIQLKQTEGRTDWER